MIRLSLTPKTLSIFLNPSEDGFFVKDINDDPIDCAMVKSINEIGHEMGIQTIAEFVETKQILEKLKDLKVDYAQGYYLGKPEPLFEITGY